MYDAPSLIKLLREHGFVDPVDMRPGETRIPNPQKLNLREREIESIYVEANNPF
jgi:hypothetical protein